MSRGLFIETSAIYRNEMATLPLESEKSFCWFGDFFGSPKNLTERINYTIIMVSSTRFSVRLERCEYSWAGQNGSDTYWPIDGGSEFLYLPDSFNNIAQTY